MAVAEASAELGLELILVLNGGESRPNPERLAQPFQSRRRVVAVAHGTADPHLLRLLTSSESGIAPLLETGRGFEGSVTDFEVILGQDLSPLPKGERWLLRPLLHRDGSALGALLWTVQEATPREDVERASRTLEERLLSAWSAQEAQRLWEDWQGSAPVVLVDGVGVIVQASDESCELLEHSTKELLGMRFDSLVDPRDRCRLMRACSAASSLLPLEVRLLDGQPIELCVEVLSNESKLSALSLQRVTAPLIEPATLQAGWRHSFGFASEPSLQSAQSSVFHASRDAIAVFEVSLSTSGRPLDLVLRAFNPAFERCKDLTGDRLASGSSIFAMTDCIGSEFVEKAGNTALTGQKSQMTLCHPGDDETFEVTCFSSAFCFVTTLFEDVSDRHRVSAAQAQAARNVAWLSQSAMEFLTLDAEANLLEFVLDKMAEIVGPSVLATATDLGGGLALEVCGVRCSDPRASNLLERWGWNLQEVILPLDTTLLQILSEATLTKLQGGLSDLCSGRLPKSVAASIETLLGLGDAYIIGIVAGGTVRGAVTFFQCEGAQPPDKDLIEAFIHHAAIAIVGRGSAQSLRTSEAQFRRLAENVKDCIWTVDSSLRYTYATPSALPLMGYEPEEVVGLSLFESISPRSIIDARRAVAKVTEQAERPIAQRKPTRAQLLEQFRKDGTRFWSEVSANVLLDENGRFDGLIGVTRDISERVRNDERRRELEEQLAQAQKMDALGTLAGGIAHEINNILAAIMGLADNLRLSNPSGVSAHQTALDVLNAAKRGRGLTRAVLGFARRGKIHIESIDLQETLTDVLRLLDHSLDPMISLQVQIPQELWCIAGDASQLSQAMMNLLLNAQHACTPEGLIRISAENVWVEAAESQHALSLKPGRYVRIAVSDNGSGMSEETKKHAFEPFFTTKGSQGTGLGLSMVYGTAQQHGGACSLESALGVGTTLELMLPASDEEPKPKRPTSSNKVKALRKGKILLVDDEAIVRLMARQFLERLGFEVFEAGDGVQALEQFRAARPDLVVLDMGMPIMDGDECFGELRRLDPHARVLIISGFAPRSTIDRLMQNGAIGIIDKPFEFDELLDKIDECFEAEATP